MKARHVVCAVMLLLSASTGCWAWTATANTHQPVGFSMLLPNNPTSQQQQQRQQYTVLQARVAIVGTGAVGSYYGARLWETQRHDVTFLLRNEHYERATHDGLRVDSVDGDMKVTPSEDNADNSSEQSDAASLLFAEDTQVMAKNGPFDWVVVALKSTALHVIPQLIQPLLDPDRTRILVIMNGLIEDDLIHMMREQIDGINNDDNDFNQPLQCCQTLYGGMALICSNRIGPAHVEHTYGGKLSVGVACTKSSAAKDEAALVDVFRDVRNVPVVWEASLRAGRWRKMVWNLPFNGISVAMGGITIDKVVEDTDLRQLSYLVMDETIAAANAELSLVYGKLNFEPLGDKEKQAMMELSDGMGPYKTSTMLDLIARRPMEVKYMFLEPVRKAEELSVPIPHLKTLVAQISAFQRLYGL